MDYIVRLESIKLENFKNVKNGELSFIKAYNQVDKLKKCNVDNITSNVMGIYGQNGSGKTSVIDSIYILKQLLSGYTLDTDCYKYIKQEENTLRCSFTFFLIPSSNINPKFCVVYSFCLKRLNNNDFLLQSELLKYTAVYNDGKIVSGKIVDYDKEQSDYYSSFMKLDDLKLLKKNSKDIYEKLKAYLLVNMNPKASFIFIKENYDALVTGFKDDIYISTILKALNEYAKDFLVVYRNNYSVEKREREVISFNSKINKVNFFEIFFSTYGPYPIIIAEDNLDYFQVMINNLNTVLKTIIPNMTITIKNEGSYILHNGKNGIKIVLCSKCNSGEFPLKYESDGIKKIISILGILIEVYNNPSVTFIIDDFDTYIFEYLLGEILKIVNNFGKGQLLFTAHNLRALEVISPKSLYFTTVNPSNKFIQLSYVKANNNVRDLYYTNIQSLQLGNIQDSLYEMIDTSVIKNAMDEEN